MKSVLKLIGACAIGCSSLAAKSNACDAVSIFSGETILSKAEMPNSRGFGGYVYFLLLNNKRGDDGVLRSYIKAKLVPARWGFDIELPSGNRVGQVMVDVSDPNLPKGTTEVMVDEEKCPDKESIFLTRSGKNSFSARYKGKAIGLLESRYSNLFR